MSTYTILPKDDSNLDIGISGDDGSQVVVVDTATQQVTVTENVVTVNVTPGLVGSLTVDSVNGHTGVVVLDTDDINEDANPSNKYYTEARFTSSLGSANTDQLSEGTTNKYYADSLARGAISASGDIQYDSSTGIISFVGSPGLVTSVNGQGGTVVLDTDDVNEGTGGNLYFTTARFNEKMDEATTDVLTEGSNNLYYTQVRTQNVITANSENFLKSINGRTGPVATMDTDDLPESGSPTNKYYTDVRARLSVTCVDSGGDGSLVYNNSTGVFTYTGPNAAEVRAHLGVANTAGGDGTLSYNASTGIYTFSGPTPAETRAHFSAVDSGGDGSFSYDDSTGVFTYTGPSAAEVRAHITAGEGIDFSGGVISGEDASYTNKGIAKYNIDEFYVDGGTVNIAADGIDSTHIDFGTGANQVSTTNLPEGSNLYYTDARWDTKMAAADTDDLSEGSNLYYTDARARNSISVSDSGGDGSLSYDASTGTITYTGPSAAEVQAHFSATDAGGDGSFSYSNGVFTYTGPSSAEVWAHFTGGTGVTFNNGDISIGQPVGTSDDVTFGEVTATEFIGPVRGGNIFKAKATEALSKGDAVYIDGISGSTPTVSKADANNSAKMPAFGLARTDANANANVDIQVAGQLTNIDTSSFTLGANLYVSNTPGVLTDTPPGGETSLLQNLGKVEKVHSTTGAIFVTGAGRTNATPNLDDGNIFIGDANNKSSTATLNTALVPEDPNSTVTSGTMYYTDTRVATKVNQAFVNALGITATGVEANSVALGTDTTGNYVATVSGTTNEIEVSGSGGEGSGVQVGLPNNVTVNNDLTVGGDVGITGDLTVSGTTTTVDTTNLLIKDNLFKLNKDQTGTPIKDSGMIVERGDEDNVAFIWDESTDKFTLGTTTATGTESTITVTKGTLTADIDGNVTGNLTGDVTGDITGDLTGDVTGTVSSIANHSTTNLAEGNNLYYTAARDTAQFNTDLATKTTSNLTEGSNLYYTDARADARIAAADTDDLSEGSTNLYYTDARADARIGAADLSDLADVYTGNPSDEQVLSWSAANSRWESADQVPSADLVTLNGTQTLTNKTLNTILHSDADGVHIYYSGGNPSKIKLGGITSGTLNSNVNGDLTSVQSATRIGHNISGLGTIPTSTSGSVISYPDYGYSTQAAAIAEAGGSSDPWLTKKITDFTLHRPDVSNLTTSELFSVSAFYPGGYNLSQIEKTSGQNTGTYYNIRPDDNADHISELNLTGSAAATSGFTSDWAYNRIASRTTTTEAGGTLGHLDITGAAISFFDNEYRFPSSDGSSNQVLATNGSGGLYWKTLSTYDNSDVDTHLNLSSASTGKVLSWTGTDYDWVAQSGGGSGTVTSVDSGTGLTGGPITTTGTLNVDVGTGANQIVQLDGSSRLPAVDGSQLTNMPAGTTINNNADNRLITGSSTSNTLEGNADVTYDGDHFDVKGTADGTNQSFTSIQNAVMNIKTDNNGWDKAQLTLEDNDSKAVAFVGQNDGNFDTDKFVVMLDPEGNHNPSGAYTGDYGFYFNKDYTDIDDGDIIMRHNIYGASSHFQLEVHGDAQSSYDFKPFNIKAEKLRILCRDAQNSTTEALRIEDGGVWFYENYQFPTNDGSIGQTLMTDGNGDVQWTTPPVTLTGSELLSNKTLSAPVISGGITYPANTGNGNTFTPLKITNEYDSSLANDYSIWNGAFHLENYTDPYNKKINVWQLSSENRKNFFRIDLENKVKVNSDGTREASSVTAGNFVTGNRYQITSVGTTDFTQIGAASNTVNLTFTATGAGSGTGTADNWDTGSGSVLFSLKGADDIGFVLASSGLSVGTKYRIHSVGTTDFTAVGAANNNVGTEFVCDATGSSGSGVAVDMTPDAGEFNQFTAHTGTQTPPGWSTNLSFDAEKIRIHGAYNLPKSDGNNGQVITTDGNGQLSFADPETITLTELKSVVAASSDFADFKSRIAAL